MTWEQDAAAAIRGLKAENERLREENNVLSAREARAENSALHLGALVDELRELLLDARDMIRAGIDDYDGVQEDALVGRIAAALAGAAVQPTVCTECGAKTWPDERQDIIGNDGTWHKPGCTADPTSGGHSADPA